MTKLKLPTYSSGTVKNDIQTLLKEWQEKRLDITDEVIRLELERIDDINVELWSQWDKSKKQRVETLCLFKFI